MKDMTVQEGRRTCLVQGLPDTVDAGSAIPLRVEVTADPPCDLSGIEVEIVDHDGATVRTARLGPGADGDAHRFVTDEVTITAPGNACEVRLHAHLAPLTVDAVSYPAAEAEIRTAVVAHLIAPVVWDVPQAVAPGEVFTIKVGARCLSGCCSSGWEVTIFDTAGTACASSVTGNTAWAGTEGLFYATLEITAPDEVGLSRLEAVVAAPDADLPHETGRRGFSLHTAPPADAVLRVSAADAGTGEPLSGLKVVAGPFLARTGTDGKAVLAVPRGRHRVFVSGGTYIPFQTDCVIETEEVLDVVLEPDTGLTEGMMWG